MTFSLVSPGIVTRVVLWLGSRCGGGRADNWCAQAAAQQRQRAEKKLAQPAASAGPGAIYIQSGAHPTGAAGLSEPRHERERACRRSSKRRRLPASKRRRPRAFSFAGTIPASLRADPLAMHARRASTWLFSSSPPHTTSIWSNPWGLTKLQRLLGR